MFDMYSFVKLSYQQDHGRMYDYLGHNGQTIVFTLIAVNQGCFNLTIKSTIHFEWVHNLLRLQPSPPAASALMQVQFLTYLVIFSNLGAGCGSLPLSPGSKLDHVGVTNYVVAEKVAHQRNQTGKTQASDGESFSCSGPTHNAVRDIFQRYRA